MCDINKQLHALLPSLKVGDQDSWTRLFALTRPRLLAYLEARGGGKHVDDAIQQTYLHLFQRIDQLDELTIAYVCKCGSWKIQDLRKKRDDVGRIDTSSLAELSGALSMQVHTRRRNRLEELDELAHAMDSLTQREQHVIRARFVEKRTLEETGQTIGLKISATRAIQERALTKLRHRLEVNQERLSASPSQQA